MQTTSPAIAKVIEVREDVKFKIVPTDKISKRPIVRICLPKTHMDKHKLVQSLRLKNPKIPLDDE